MPPDAGADAAGWCGGDEEPAAPAEGWLATADDAELATLAAHLRWLYDVVLREKVPDSAFASRFVDRLCKVCQPLETHRDGARSLFARHPHLLTLVCDGALYVFGAEVVFAEVPPTVARYLNAGGGKRDAARTMSVVLRWLSNRHNLDLGDVPLCDTAEALCDAAAPRADLHNALIGFLLHHYCASFLQPADVEAHVTSFAPLLPGEGGGDVGLEGALLLWMRKVCGLFSSAGGDAGWAGGGRDLYDAMADGRLLSVVFYKYDTSFLPLHSVELGDELTPRQRVGNWAVLLDACRRSRINPPFSAHDAVAFPAELRLHMLWLAQMCLSVLRKATEGLLGGCPLLAEQQAAPAADGPPLALRRLHGLPPSRLTPPPSPPQPTNTNSSEPTPGSGNAAPRATPRDGRGRREGKENKPPNEPAKAPAAGGDGGGGGRGRSPPPADSAAQRAVAARNRQHAANALRHLCLPGKINAAALQDALSAMDRALSEAGERAGSLRFVLHVKAAQQPLLKSVYAAAPGDGGELIRVHGCGPRRLRCHHPGVTAQCLRYDSGSRRFVGLPTTFAAADPAVDAVVLCPTKTA